MNDDDDNFNLVWVEIKSDNNSRLICFEAGFGLALGYTLSKIMDHSIQLPLIQDLFEKGLTSRRVKLRKCETYMYFF